MKSRIKKPDEYINHRALRLPGVDRRVRRSMRRRRITVMMRFLLGGFVCVSHGQCLFYGAPITVAARALSLWAVPVEASCFPSAHSAVGFCYIVLHETLTADLHKSLGKNVLLESPKLNLREKPDFGGVISNRSIGISTRLEGGEKFDEQMLRFRIKR